MEILLAEISENREIVRQIWIDNIKKPVDIIEYVACSEAHGSLSLAIGHKSSFSEFNDAFFSIWLKNICFGEGWDNLDISEPNDPIDINYLISESSQWRVSELSSSQLTSEFTWRSNEMKIGIKEVKSSYYADYTNYLPGIYMNGVIVENYQKFEAPVLLDPYCQGIILENEWNKVTYFVETESGFVYYDWGTSA
jgi:hypothetical protein